jgi:hypothetical protein
MSEKLQASERKGKIFVGKAEGNRPLGSPRIDGRTKL